MPVIKHVRLILFAAFCAGGLFWTGCAEDSPSVVVTTSMLGEATRDVLGNADELRIVLLLPPGDCPGHFDLSPRALPALKSARAVLRHHYQDFLDERLKEIGAGGVAAISISTPSSLLIPENYIKLLGQIADVLAEQFPEKRERIQAAREAAAPRLEAFAKETRERAAPLKGRAVIASANQKEFCEWLGLEVAGVLKRPEEVTPRDYEDLVGCKALAVIANLQEGLDAAESLARRKEIPLVILSNFPNAQGYGAGYAELVKANLDRIEKTLK